MKLTYDQINAGLEMGGAFLRALDCVKLFRAKRFVGGYLGTAMYFLLWGIFNTFYYPSLNQTWSFAAAIALAAMNGLWFVMAIHYNYFASGRRNYDPQTIMAGLLFAGVVYGMVFHGGWQYVTGWYN